MKPGHGEVLIAEGDPRVSEEHELLVDEFRRQLDGGSGRRRAELVQHYADIPPAAERVIFFPRAAGG